MDAGSALADIAANRRRRCAHFFLLHSVQGKRIGSYPHNLGEVPTAHKDLVIDMSQRFLFKIEVAQPRARARICERWAGKGKSGGQHGAGGETISRSVAG